MKTQKRLASFEQRFLSACGTGEHCILEVAMVWPDNDYVLAIHQYEFQPGMEISVGSEPGCQYQIDLPCEKFVIARCDSHHQWTLCHTNEMQGFVLDGENKTDFAQSEYKTSVDKSIRAKYIFGEVSILVHFIDRTDFHADHSDFYHCAQKAVRGGLAIHNYTALIASLLIHFVGLSVGLFAPGHVSALMVDRFTTSSRFEVVVSPEIPTVTEEAPITEPVPGQAEDPENVFEQVMAIDRAKPQSSPLSADFAFHKALSGLSPNSPENIARIAQQWANSTGRLVQTETVATMIAANNAKSVLDIDWAQFDELVSVKPKRFEIPYPSFGPSTGSGRFDDTDRLRMLARIASGFRSLGSEWCESNYCIMPGKKPASYIGEDPERTSVTIKGSLDRRVIDKTIRQHMGELKECYEQVINQRQNQRDKSKKPEGTLYLMWIIAGNGSVTDIKLTDSTLHNITVESSVVNAIRYWRFPTAVNDGMTKVEYPFSFSATP